MLLKGVGLLVNLTQDGSPDWATVLEDTTLLVSIETLLESYSGVGGGGAGVGGGVVEQCLCVLVNLSSCNEATRQALVRSDYILHQLTNILVRFSLHQEWLMRDCVCVYTCCSVCFSCCRGPATMWRC